jgi:hypothetical protein
MVLIFFTAHLHVSHARIYSVANYAVINFTTPTAAERFWFDFHSHLWRGYPSYISMTAIARDEVCKTFNTEFVFDGNSVYSIVHFWFIFGDCSTGHPALEGYYAELSWINVLLPSSRWQIVTIPSSP